MRSSAPPRRGQALLAWLCFLLSAADAAALEPMAPEFVCQRRDIYFRQDRPGVALFLECDSVEEAMKVHADLPLVKAGLIDFAAIPLGPFTNWEFLFAPEHK